LLVALLVTVLAGGLTFYLAWRAFGWPGPLHLGDPPVGIDPVLVREDWPDYGRYRLVLDAGHGGRDPGTVPAGVEEAEKNVNLRYALAAQAQLESEGHWRVLQTRKGDSNPSRGRRASLCGLHGADAFISLHANATGGAKPRGAMVIWSPRQRTEVARQSEWLAAFVGAALQDAGFSLFHYHESAFDRGIADTRDYLPWWPSLGGHIDVGKRLTVLERNTCPAILLETHFRTNPQDVALFAAPSSEARFGLALSTALRSWIAWRDRGDEPRQVPTEGSWTLQVAAPRDEAVAAGMAAKLREEGFEDVRIEQVATAESTLRHRVRVGRMGTRQELLGLRARLLAVGFEETWAVPLGSH